MTDSRIAHPRRLLTAALAALALLLAGAGVAHAGLTRLDGETTFTPSAQATEFLAAKGISVEPVDPATADGGAFTFPIGLAFGDTKRFRGVLAHRGGLRFSKGERSAVIRGFVAVRTKRRALLLAKVPGLRGACKPVKRAAKRFFAKRPAKRFFAKRPEARERGRSKARSVARRHPKGARRVVTRLRKYCKGGRVIVLAKLENLGKSVSGSTATLTADLRLSRQAAKLLNRRFDADVPAGAPLGSAESTVTPAE